MMNIVIFIVVCLARLACGGGCPPAEELAPLCNCRTYGGADGELFCYDVLDPDQLVAPMRSLSKYHSLTTAFQLQYSVLTYLPSHVFEGTPIEMIQFSRTEIMSLSDTDIAFRGLENTLRVIIVKEVEFVDSWNWQQVRNLKNLNIISLDQISMESVDDPFPYLPNLIAIDITEAGLTYVVEGAFSQLPNLMILNLQNNKIEELKRNILPDPAESLINLDLSNNLLRSLPEDFFSNMPRIRAVHLDKNQFTTLPEEPFKFAFQNLVVFSLDDNPLRCDCRMRWLVGLETRYPSNAECTAPASLKGHTLASLEINQLWC